MNNSKFKKTAIIIIFLTICSFVTNRFSLSQEQALQDKSSSIQKGIYTLSESSGETAGGSSVNYETKVYLFDISGEGNAYIVRDGYQTATRYWATPALHNNVLTLTYQECGSQLHTLACSTKNRGDIVLKITKKNGKYIFSGSMFESENDLDTVTKSTLNITKDKVITLTE